MRTLNSAKNLASSLGLSILMVVMGFVTRKIFVDNVGVEYLGLNGLLQNILGLMTLLEGGFATSVVYNMYKPLAEDDRPRILALLQLYRKVYRYIAGGVFLCGLAIYPFIGYLIKDADGLSYVSVVYFIFLFNSLVQYFTAYKWSIINASQKNYKLTVINLVYQVGLSLGKMAILYYTKNYILYLVVEALFGVGYNIAIVRKANQLFPYIVTKVKYAVEPAVKKNIIANMKALFLHSLGGYFMHSTDNIVISAFIGVGIIGLWSNYTLLTGTVSTFITQTLNSFSESVGHLIASESKQKVYEVFKTIFFVNFIVVSIPVVLMWATLSPFISWWLGSEYELSPVMVGIVLFNFYINGMRSSAMTFKTKSGIFVKDRWTPLLQGLINLGLSLLLVQRFGLSGVLAATGISILSIGFWQWPLLCYKYAFNQPLRKYFAHYGAYTLVGATALFLSMWVCSLVSIDNKLLDVVWRGVSSLAVVCVVYWTAFRRTEPYRELMVYVKSIIGQLRPVKS